MKTMSATEFKAKCLAVLDDVNRTQEPVVVLKRGKPVARVVPPVDTTEAPPQASLVGSVRILGDVVAPAMDAGEWDAEAGSE